LQREELAEADPGTHGGKEQRQPLGHDGVEQLVDLRRRQDLDLGLLVFPEGARTPEGAAPAQPVRHQVAALAGVLEDLVEEHEMVLERLDAEGPLAAS
jgi:hypothetical protein